MISRRMLLVTATAAVVLDTPRLAPAQATVRLPRVVLFTFTPQHKDSFVAGLHDLGWVEGHDVIVDWRRASLPREREKELDTEVTRKPEVLVLSNPLTIAAGMRATRTIPIVGIDVESDPVAAGFVASLARPGGNVTGIWLDLPELAGKLVQLLHEAIPRLATAGVLWDDRVGLPQLRATQQAAQAVGLRLVPVSVNHGSDIGQAIERMVREGARALVVLSAPEFNRRPTQIAELALKHRLPSIGLFPLFTEAGGLMAYGPSLSVMYRMAARQVARILHGTHPSELPVERPATFDLIFNDRTAKALALVIPQSLLARATRVLE